MRVCFSGARCISKEDYILNSRGISGRQNNPDIKINPFPRPEPSVPSDTGKKIIIIISQSGDVLSTFFEL